MNVVAPGITLEDYNEGRAKPIDLFERRIMHWIFPFAKYLAHQHEQKQDAGIPVLVLTSAVIEPLGGVLPLRKGRRTSEVNFCNGFVRAFPEVPGSDDTWKLAERVCDLLRHGLFHESFIKPGLRLTLQEQPILEKSGVVYIDPGHFLDSVESTFGEVCSEIRTAEEGSPVRQAFDSYWNQKEMEQARKSEPVVKADPDDQIATSTNTLASVPVDRFLKYL